MNESDSLCRYGLILFLLIYKFQNTVTYKKPKNHNTDPNLVRLVIYVLFHKHFFHKIIYTSVKIYDKMTIWIDEELKQERPISNII